MTAQPSQQTPHTSGSTTPSALVGLLNLISKLPLPVLQLIAGWIAFLLCILPKQKLLNTIERNLLLAFPEWDTSTRQQTARQALRSQSLSMVEFLKSWGMPPQYSIEKIQHVHGEALFHDALASKQGLILVLPHFGSWEMMNAWFNQFTPIVIMYKPDTNPAINQFVRQARSSLNATLVPTNESGVRQLFKALKQGGTIAILPDHIPEQAGGIYSPFFNRPVLTSTLVSKLAQKTQCQVLQLACTRNDQHGFDIYIETVHEDIRSSNLQASVDALNISMENLVRRHPAQYHWNYKRFKALPILDQAYYVTEPAALSLAAQSSQQFDYLNQRMPD